ncbi:hypothetical protein ACFPOI_24515 [Nonomuraea angiospora]|uniref:Uncharacterized protein n=1 Tax=Nonomuraea angiospora TaxID=46172 RepID=A0ABR9MLQ9_9ACTN|nr:hypothetical protein [Nonomuraea angiospora]MBE1593842.1 hypothetical protein [Nonomuraea angiospora]
MAGPLPEPGPRLRQLAGRAGQVVRTSTSSVNDQALPAGSTVIRT